MSGDEAALYRAILDSPLEDGPRLVYADWLQENGDPQRAEFIRTQVATDGRPGEDLLLERFLTRRGARRSMRRIDMLRPDLPPDFIWQSPSFRRGLPAAVHTECPRAFVGAGEQLFAAVPVEALEVHWYLRQRGAADLFDSPHLGRLRELTLWSGFLGRTLLTRLGRSPHAGNLRRLGLQHIAATPDGFEALGRTPLWHQLEELDLSWQDGDLDERLERMAPARSLRSLRVSNSVFVGRGIPGRLRRLHANAAQFSLAGVRRLAADPAVQSLCELRLEANNLGPAAVRALARSPHLAGLTVLGLRNNPIGDTAAAELAASPHLRRLELLGLSGAHVTDAGARALLGSANFERLVWLDLRDNAISLAVRRALRKRFGDRVSV
jgi:uncharacterized protein (TIGR02996 family)